jgi:hypothetical protein
MISKEAFGECRFWLDHVDSLNEIGSQLCQLTYNETQDFHQSSQSDFLLRLSAFVVCFSRYPYNAQFDRMFHAEFVNFYNT